MQKIITILLTLASFAIPGISRPQQQRFILSRPPDSSSQIPSSLYNTLKVTTKYHSVVERSVLDRRYEDSCGYATPAAVSDLQACVNYLLALGTVNGSSATTDSTFSICSDVVAGAQWVLDNCKGAVEYELKDHAQGYAAANGNGNLIVTVGGA
ncbi:hypothetical protein B7494_g1392 [Chlorociboria aeruginascens]|nr:hypothetical protein B7494_g1392 [Chlorociboria aeruginascens]